LVAVAVFFPGGDETAGGRRLTQKLFLCFFLNSFTVSFSDYHPSLFFLFFSTTTTITMTSVPEDPAALRPVEVKVIGARAGAAAAAAAAAAASGGGNANASTAADNSTPDVRLVTIQAAPNFTKSQIKAAVEQAGGPPARYQRLMLSNVDALCVLDRRALGVGVGGAGGGGAGGGGGTKGGLEGLLLGVAPCGVASSASLALSGQPAVQAPAPKD
jgi:hypothetical protein